MSDERCPTCGQRVQVETTGEGTSRFVPVAVEDGGYWEDRATAAEAEVERLREGLPAAAAQWVREHADDLGLDPEGSAEVADELSRFVAEAAG